MNAPIDDTTLHAWLDGELPPEQRAAVDAWLRENPEQAARVRLWAADREALHALLDPALAEPVPAALERVVWQRRPAARWPGVWRVAAGVALFALGGALGSALTWRHAAAPGAPLAEADEDAWVHRAAVAHSVYVPEVRHAVEVKAQEEHLARWLTKRIEVPVKLFDLREQGFELVGGRLLPDANGPCAQLMYQALPDAGDTAQTRPARVTVYLRKPDATTPASFRFERDGELGLFYWVEGDSVHGKATGYALVGALPRERLLALAEAIYRQGAATP